VVERIIEQTHTLLSPYIHVIVKNNDG
jgi:hypothetical protein